MLCAIILLGVPGLSKEDAITDGDYNHNGVVPKTGLAETRAARSRRLLSLVMTVDLQKIVDHLMTITTIT